jgi:hypothetical protein
MEPSRVKVTQKKRLRVVDVDVDRNCRSRPEACRRASRRRPDSDRRVGRLRAG